jgi:hypothetical protein
MITFYKSGKSVSEVSVNNLVSSSPAKYEAGDAESHSRKCLARRFRVRISAHDVGVSLKIETASTEACTWHLVHEC